MPTHPFLPKLSYGDMSPDQTSLGPRGRKLISLNLLISRMTLQKYNLRRWRFPVMIARR